MRAFLIISFIFSFLCSFGQDTIFVRFDRDKSDDVITYIVDTVVMRSPFYNHVLIGTTILPNTYNQQRAIEYGFIMNKVKSSPCNARGRIDKLNNTVNKITKTDSTWSIDIAIVENCCYDFLCDLSIENDSILNLIYHGYGSGFCACSCCFGLVFELNVYKYEKSEKIKLIMINTDKRTLKRIESLLSN